MRFVSIILFLASVPSLALGGEPTQLPKRCVADSPADRPCTSFTGMYHLKIAPSANDKKCFVTKPIEADVTIGKAKQKGLVEVDAKSLVKGLGWKPRADDEDEASAALREGVCCIDVRLTQTTGKKGDETESRLIVHLACGFDYLCSGDGRYRHPPRGTTLM